MQPGLLNGMRYIWCGRKKEMLNIVGASVPVIVFLCNTNERI